jgi:ABC-type bacteriocin/lantibiotic exporter with double-glycine peptidase domain
VAKVLDLKTVSDKKNQLKSTFLESSSHLLKTFKKRIQQKNLRTKLTNEEQDKNIKKAKTYTIVSIILGLFTFLFVVAAILIFVLLYDYIIAMLIAVIGVPFAIIGIILYPLYKKKIRGIEIDPKEKAKMKRKARAGLIISIVFLGMLGFIFLLSLMGNFI